MPEPFRLSYTLASFPPTTYLVGGFLGYALNCKHAVVFAASPSNELDRLQQFFNLILPDLGADEKLSQDPLILSEAIVIGVISCADEGGLPTLLARAAQSARLSVIAELRASAEPAQGERRLARALALSELTPTFIGSAPSGKAGESNAIAIIDRRPTPGNLTSGPPASFRVIAMMTVFNEGDVLLKSIEKLLVQGIEVYLIDNWSTDGSYEAVAEEFGSDLVGLERFPPTSPNGSFDLYAQLLRKEELAKTLRADWFIHCDADEIRCSPWQGMSLRDAVYRVDLEGYNAVNQTIVEFHPVDDGFQRGADFEDYFRYFSFGTQAGDYVRVNMWKNTGQPISLAARAGHQVLFGGRRVYPYKFLTKHYPIRSQEHGWRKVFRERRPRYNATERARGWHTHLDALPNDHNFLKDAATLTRFDDERFYGDYLIQRLTGIGTLIEGPIVRHEI